MSTAKGFQGWGTAEAPGDEKLLRFLWTHKHMSPFEMAGLVVEVQAPIFVFREWHRHRTQSFNEMSARYTPLPDVNYMPTTERIMMSGGSNKQAGSVAGKHVNSNTADAFIRLLREHYNDAQDVYQQALDWGIPKELARAALPVGRYSRMRASANLRNWLHFLTLRCDENAQWEIRQYANIVSEIIRHLFPRTHQLWSAK
jgi:thymidylate synthase (FAD)